MRGSTLQVRTRHPHESSWQEDVELKVLSEPDYSSIPKAKQHVALMLDDSKSSIGTQSAQGEEDTFVREETRKKILQFFRGFVSAVGFAPDGLRWHYAFGLALMFAILYWVVAWGSLYFILGDFASFWPPNGVYVGALLRGSPRARRFAIVLLAISIFTVNLAWGNDYVRSAGFVVINSFECTLIASISLGLAGVGNNKKSLSLLHRRHLIAVGLGIFIGCGVSGNLGSVFSMWKLNPNRDYGSTYLKFMGSNLVGSALVVPVLLSIPFHGRVRDVPAACLHFIRTRTKLVVEASVFTVILVCIPAVSAYVINGSALSAVAGLYVTYPAVLYAGAKFGSFGASGASLVVGLSSAVSTLLLSTHDIVWFDDSTHVLSVQDQFVWMQLFLVVLVSTSLFFVVILAERDRARANIESKVHQRTEELTVALAKLDDALRKAETADNDKAVFFSFLCHELRNPLHVISNMANFMEENHDSNMPEVKAIKSSSKYMLALVSDVLDLGRFEAGRVVLENLTVDVHSLLESNFSCAAHMAESHQIMFESEVDKTIPTWLSVDAIRLQQILNNLISNAFKFTPKGGRINVEVRAINFFHGVNPQSAVDLVATSLSCRDTLHHKPRLSVDDVTSVRSHDTSFYAKSTGSSRYKMKIKQKLKRKRREEEAGGREATEARDEYGDMRCSGQSVISNLSRGTHSENNTIRSSGGSHFSALSSTHHRTGSHTHDNNHKAHKRDHSNSNHSNNNNSTIRPQLPDIAVEENDETSTRRSSNASSGTSAFSPSVISPSSVFSPSGTSVGVVGAGGDGGMVAGAGGGGEGVAVEVREEGEEGRGDGEAGEEGDWVVVEVSVSDTGIGIDPAIVSKLFRPYAQAAVSTMREYGGSGLGLAITNQIVRLMGGSVYVETEIGKGSKFTFTVPLAIVNKSTKTSEPTPPPEIISPLSPPLRQPSPILTGPADHSAMTNEQALLPNGESNNKNDENNKKQNHGEIVNPIFQILIVDDSSINRSILISMVNKVLNKGTFVIEIAINGLEAVEKCEKKYGAEYNLIFMDIVMPVMDGWEACRRIRASGFSKHIIITTANQVTGDAASEVIAVGATEAISKPFSKDHIQNVLARFGAGHAIKIL